MEKQISTIKGLKKAKMMQLFEPTTKDGVRTKMLKKSEEELNRFSSKRIRIMEKEGQTSANS